MAAEDDPLGGAEEQMLAHEVEAFYALLRKVRSRLGDLPAELTDGDPGAQVDIAVAAAFKQALAEDADVPELAAQVAAFLRFGDAQATSAEDPRDDVDPSGDQGQAPHGGGARR